MRLISTELHLVLHLHYLLSVNKALQNFKMNNYNFLNRNQ